MISRFQDIMQHCKDIMEIKYKRFVNHD
jgi:hypothetical protein